MLCGPREFTLLNLLSKFHSPDFDRDIVYTKSGHLTLQGTETVPSPGSLRYLACPRCGQGALLFSAVHTYQRPPARPPSSSPQSRTTTRSASPTNVTTSLYTRTSSPSALLSTRPPNSTTLLFPCLWLLTPPAPSTARTKFQH